MVDVRQHGDRPSDDTVADRAWLRQLRRRPRWWPIAAALALGGALVGFALPVPSAQTGTGGRGAAASREREAHELDPGREHADQRAAGSSLMDEYARIDPNNEPALHRFVLEQVARGNLPSTWNHWVTVTVHGRRGTVVEFDVSPHGLRLGTDADWVEVPLDGPHFAAAAELLGCRLATAWMVEQIYRQARRTGGAVHYFSASEIAASLGWHDWDNNAPDGAKMKSATFFRQRTLLLRRWLDEHDIPDDALVAGYFKTVVTPIDGLTRRRGLEIVGGHDERGRQVQPLSGGLHGQRFFDYSHNVRFVRDEIRVNGQSLTLREFFTNVGYAREFLFRYTVITDRPYRYPSHLAHWIQKTEQRPVVRQDGR